jgi:hypothetical protein
LFKKWKLISKYQYVEIIIIKKGKIQYSNLLKGDFIYNNYFVCYFTRQAQLCEWFIFSIIFMVNQPQGY